MAKAVVGSFDSFDEARAVCDELQQRGFAKDDLSIVAHEASAKTARTSGEEEVPVVMRSTAAGVPAGAVTGGVFGAGMGLIGSLMGLAIPGIGPIVAAGPLAATLAGAGIGAVAGGLIGGLVELGVPEEHADYYAESVRRGGTLVTARTTDERAQEAAEVMRQRGAVDIERRAAHWRETGWTGHDPKAPPYTAEQIERERPAYRDASGRPLHAAGGDATATVGSSTMGGRPLSGGLVSGPGVPDNDWGESRSHFRTHYTDTYASAGRFEDYEPAYRYGWEAGRNSRYRGRSWNDVEPDLRRDWERRYPEGGAWDRFKAAVRRGWERTSEAVDHAFDSDHGRH